MLKLTKKVILVIICLNKLSFFLDPLLKARESYKFSAVCTYVRTTYVCAFRDFSQNLIIIFVWYFGLS